MKAQTLTVPEISCGHCKVSIEGAVSALHGVDTVEVHIEEKTVEVAFDPDTVDIDAIIAAIEEQGYAVPR